MLISLSMTINVCGLFVQAESVLPSCPVIVPADFCIPLLSAPVPSRF